MKSKQELIEKWESAIEAAEFYGKGKEDRLIEYMRNFVDDLNRLDEPEVLSQEWISDHIIFNEKEDAEYIYADKLQNLLVPKQEETTEEQAWELLSDIYDIANEGFVREAMKIISNNVTHDTTIGELRERLEKPVIPQFVADWLESRKNIGWDLTLTLKEGCDPNPDDWSEREWFEDWILLKKWLRKKKENDELLARAYVYGYEIEPEPQYRLKAGNNYLYFNLDGTVRGATKDNATITNERLEQLPFDVEKAVESGIIEIEEVEE